MGLLMRPAGETPASAPSRTPRQHHTYMCTHFARPLALLEPPLSCKFSCRGNRQHVVWQDLILIGAFSQKQTHSSFIHRKQIILKSLLFLLCLVLDVITFCCCRLQWSSVLLPATYLVFLDHLQFTRPAKWGRSISESHWKPSRSVTHGPAWSVPSLIFDMVAWPFAGDVKAFAKHLQLPAGQQISASKYRGSSDNSGRTVQWLLWTTCGCCNSFLVVCHKF